MKKYILKVYYKLLDLKDLIIIFYNKKFVSKRKPPIVLNTDVTLEKITGVRCSVSRFGDGEFALMYGENLIFQPQDKELSLRLKEIINSNIDNHIVCLPNIFEGVNLLSCYEKIA
ncbi:GT-D fold domain-containing glycosyltransferase [Clostridium perfringens]|uniref:GT-D fold domain-containing glycosyltransferase n=1 Tax=Clostridium perfringens TaxID=1502 RepID=UPI003F430B72